MATRNNEDKTRPVRGTRRAIEKFQSLPVAVLLVALLCTGIAPLAEARFTSCVDVELTNDANGCVAVSGTGNANGSALAASLTGDSTSNGLAVSGTGDVNAPVAGSITGNDTRECGIGYSPFGNGLRPWCLYPGPMVVETDVVPEPREFRLPHEIATPADLGNPSVGTPDVLGRLGDLDRVASKCQWVNNGVDVRVGDTACKGRFDCINNGVEVQVGNSGCTTCTNNGVAVWVGRSCWGGPSSGGACVGRECVTYLTDEVQRSLA
jgi:hypothetical protein